MNQETILQSNLLDIIFENRNKDYGAYNLRKFYSNRISAAVFSMIGLSVMISIFLLNVHSTLVLTNDAFKLPIPEKILSVYNPDTHSAQMKTEKVNPPATRKIPDAERPPRIVTEANIINKPVATQIENIPSLSAIGTPQKAL
jgi:periplasmic protein TonB